MHTKALVFTASNVVGVQTVEIPSPGKREVLIEVTLSCISPGTELRCAAGDQPGGSDAFPFVPGYATVGRVVEAGAECELPVGTRVYADGTSRLHGINCMWGGHIAHAVAAESDVSVIPDNVPDRDAVLAALGGIAYHGFKLAGASAQAKVAVVGLGPLGQLSARIFAAAGCRVAACDLDEKRVRIAQSGGVDAYVATASPAEALHNALPDGADIVVDATGAPSVLPKALELVREVPWTQDRPPGPKYVMQGSYSGDVAIPYQPAFMNEVTFLLPRDRVKADRDAFLALLAGERIEVGRIVGAIAAPIEAQSVYDGLRRPVPEHLTVAFRWPNSSTTAE